MSSKFLKQLRRALLAESFLSGTTSLKKVLNETEDELEDIIKFIDKKAKTQRILDGKLLKKRKH